MIIIEYNYQDKMVDAWRNILKASYDKLILTNQWLSEGVLVHPAGLTFDFDKLEPEVYKNYILNAEEDSVVFLNDFHSFYVHDYILLLKLATFAKWWDSYESMPTLNAYTNRHTFDELLVSDYFITWMQRQNIKFTTINYPIG